MADDNKHKKSKSKSSFGATLFNRFKPKKNKKNKKPKDNNNKKTKKDYNTKNKNKSNNKIIKITPSLPEELKESYTVSEVIEYNLQLIRSVNDVAKRKNLVTRKLRLCAVTFDFTKIDNSQQSGYLDPNNLVNGNNGNQNQNQNNNDKKNKIKNVDGIDAKMLQNGSNKNHVLTEEEIEYRKKLTIGIDKKRQMLVEIVEFISTQKWWDEDILRELISCVTKNLFRTLPLGTRRKFVKGDEEEEPFLDPQWLHLQLVYELCLRFLISNDIDKKVMQKYLHGSFVLNLIQLFQSEDLRERDYLKTILHRIYGRFMPLRQQIRTEIANECYRYVYSETRGVHGIAEFLDIFSSIINGFSIPVKEEHKAFLRNVLLPLHKCEKYEVYFQQLADCCVLFVNKEQSIATTVLGGLLKFWPTLSPTKQAFYLREMLNVIGALVEHENGFSYPKYKDIVLLCVNKIFECMESPHFQVCDQALSLWKDTVMLYLSKCQKDMIWRRLFIIFKDIQLNHWNPGIKQLTNEVVLYYERIDFQYWKNLKEEYENNANTTLTNGNTTNTQNGESDDNNKQKNGKIPIIVPKTLIPDKYANQQKQKIEKQTKQRQSKWKQIQQIADQNKQNFIKPQPQQTESKDDEKDTEETEKPILNGHNDEDINTDNKTIEKINDDNDDEKEKTADNNIESEQNTNTNNDNNENESNNNEQGTT